MPTAIKYTYHFLFACLLCVICSDSAEAQKHRVLFVGNSYTYYNSMPQLFAAISEHHMEGVQIETKFLGGGGATLKKHWEVGLVLEAVRSESWDFVVLQGQSKFGSDDLADPKSPDQFYKYAEMLEKEIRASGAETVFFMTWSRENLKDQQVYLTNAYTAIAEKLGSRLAPVGRVWDVLRDDSSLQLYTEDGSHPSITGSYVAALTLSSTIFGYHAEPVPGDLYGFEILRGGALSDERTQLSNVPDTEVYLIQRAVAEVMGSSGSQ